MSSSQRNETLRKAYRQVASVQAENGVEVKEEADKVLPVEVSLHEACTILLTGLGIGELQCLCLSLCGIRLSMVQDE